MELNRELVFRSYQLLLNREPENNFVVQNHITAHTDYLHFLQAIVGSEEYKSNHKSYLKHHDYRGFENSDANLLHKYEDKSRTIIPGCIVDYFGVITDKSFLPKVVQSIPDSVESIPIPMNFLSEAAEWMGVIESIDTSKKKFVGLELGAGWGPWSALCGVLCQRLNKEFYLVPVEAEIGKTKFIKKNFQINHIGPNHFSIINAVVGAESKEVDFPILSDASHDYGISVEKTSMKRRRDVIGFRKTQQVTIKSLLGSYKTVDLIHIDIQGHEYRAIYHSIFDINKKVRYLVIGTHSRKIEGDLFQLLWDNKWQLRREKPCIFDKNKSLDATIDGVQVWKNSRF